MEDRQRRVRLLNRHLCAGAVQVTPNYAEPSTQCSSYVSPVASEVLTDEQIRQYNEKGFLLIKGLLSQDEITAYRNRFDDICARKVPWDNMLVMRDIALAKKISKDQMKDERQITKLQDWQDDEVLFQYCKNPKVIKYVRAFIGENIRSIHTMLINKPPDVGLGSSRHPLHQDLLYFPIRPAEKIVASWTAMQRIDRENGCLSVIPGSHKFALREHELPHWEAVNKAYQGVKDITEAELGQREFLLMEPGDTVFFHPLLIHGSGRNSTDGFRKAISCHYASSDCHFSQIPEHNYGLLNELLNLTDFSEVSNSEKLEVYQLAWKLKSRRICGTDPEHWHP